MSEINLAGQTFLQKGKVLGHLYTTFVALPEYGNDWSDIAVHSAICIFICLHHYYTYRQTIQIHVQCSACTNVVLRDALQHYVHSTDTATLSWMSLDFPILYAKVWHADYSEVVVIYRLATHLQVSSPSLHWTGRNPNDDRPFTTMLLVWSAYTWLLTQCCFS